MRKMSSNSNYTTETHQSKMKNKSIRILYIISITLIILGLLLKILHYSIGFVTGDILIILGIIINIQVFFNLLNHFKENKNSL